MRPLSEAAGEPLPAALLRRPAPVGDEDRRDFLLILEHVLAERAGKGGALPDLLGLERRALDALAERYLPSAILPDRDVERAEPPQEQASLAELIRWRGVAVAPESLWLAEIIARRAMEGRHLWEDLGLPSRAALGALMARRFPRLVALNAQGMRWKKFFYRQICSEAAFSLCLAPSCDECAERAECFPTNA